MTEMEKVPAEMAPAASTPGGPGAPAEPKRKHKVLFRRAAGPARITIFEGGHEMDVQAALDWLAGQAKAARAGQ